MTPGATGRRRLFALTLALVIALATLYLLARTGAIGDFLEVLPRADFLRLAVAFSIVPLIQLLRCWRFRLLLAAGAERQTFRLYRVTALAAMINFLIPFRIGEFSFPLLMKREFGVDFGQSTGVILLVRVVDLLIVAAFLGLLGLLVLWADLAPWLRLALGGGALLALALSQLLNRVGLRLAARLLARLGGTPRLAEILRALTIGAERLEQPGRRLPFFLLTLAIWLLFMVSAYASASAVSSVIAPLEAAFAYVTSAIAFALPINGVGSLGPSQGAWWSALSLAGVESRAALVSALASHSVFLLGAVAVGLAVLPLQNRRDDATWEGSEDQAESGSPGP
jgi:hypothetical protein